MVMQGTKKERWISVYGAAYVRNIDIGEPTVNAVIGAAAEADGAIAAEPEEAEPSPAGDITVEPGDFGGVYIKSRGGCSTVLVLRSEAAALARLLLKFAETGEI